MNDTLKKIYAVFSPAPLSQGKDNLYVDLDEVRGDTSVIHRMQQKIILPDGPSCQVLAGHRGSGKSTELWKLRQALETPQIIADRMFVVQVKADEELDPNDIDFPDVLISIVRQLASELKTREGIQLKPGYFKDRWHRLKELALSKVEFEGGELDTVMGKVSAVIRSSPEARKQVRAALEPDTDNWIAAANDVIGAAVLELKAKHYSGLVIMVDGLDKMITRQLDDVGCTTTENLFVNRGAQLTSFACHLIYTVPIDLAYSHHGANIRLRYGGEFPVVPMTKIETPPPNPKTYAKGIAKFREIITTRLHSIGVTEDALFSNDRVRDDLIKLTGGQPTELMTLIREAIVTDGLPIGHKGVKRARQEALRNYRRQLKAEHWPLIMEARSTGQVQRTDENEKNLRELLECRALRLYRNDEEWYGVNPALDDLVPTATSE